MAETEHPETPEQPPETLEAEVETAASVEGAGEPTTTGAEELDRVAPSTPGTTRRERLEARRARRHAAEHSGQPKTIDERIAEREQHRERNARQRRAYRAKQKAKRAEARAAQPEEVTDAQQAHEHGPGRPKVRQGVVVSDKADKTITVRIDIVRRHKRYHKILRSTATLHAHDEANTAGAGDTVRVVETRPMSRTKRWRLLDVVERAR